MKMRRSFCCAVILAPMMILLSAPVSHANKKLPLQPLNLNTATALELQQVPCTGPSTADKILKMPVQERRRFARDQGHRAEAHGKMRKYATVGKSVAPKNAASSGAASSAPPSTAKSPPHASPKTTKQNPPTPN